VNRHGGGAIMRVTWPGIGAFVAVFVSEDHNENLASIWMCRNGTS